VLKIRIAFWPIHHHNPSVNKETENKIRKLINGEVLPVTTELKNDLSALGLKFKVRDEFVRLEDNIELLDYNSILNQTAPGFYLDLQWSIQSTNDYLMNVGASAESVVVCLAEQQLAGKGRRGKVWISPFGKNIYMSISRQFATGASGLMGLSLVIGLSVVKTLKEIGIGQVGLKWPNDIILDAGKLAGILVELGKTTSQSTFAVMGIGINMELDEEDSRQIDQPWSAIANKEIVSRNELVARLIDSILPTLVIFEREGFASFCEDWNSNNVYRGQEVMVLGGKNGISGIDAGVDENGNYLLETDTGIQIFNAGEVSLRLRG